MVDERDQPGPDRRRRGHRGEDERAGVRRHPADQRRVGAALGGGERRDDRPR
jgi:hypothetical protein